MSKSGKNMGTLGIDIGITGGICYKNDQDVILYTMPSISVENSSYSRWYDIPKILDICSNYDRSVKVYIEYQRPFEKQDIVSTFRLGRGFGLIEGIFSSKFNTVVIIDPKTWQNFLIKKFFSDEEKNLSKSKETFINLLDKIDNKYLNLFNKKISMKSFKDTKLRSLYILYKSGFIDKFNEKELSKHDLVDCFLISMYGGMIN
jgi:crossover junction endodeoxyribonuclease RuvC